MWPKINEKLHRIFSISPLPIFARMVLLYSIIVFSILLIVSIITVTSVHYIITDSIGKDLLSGSKTTLSYLDAHKKMDTSIFIYSKLPPFTNLQVYDASGKLILDNSPTYAVKQLSDRYIDEYIEHNTTQSLPDTIQGNESTRFSYYRQWDDSLGQRYYLRFSRRAARENAFLTLLSKQLLASILISLVLTILSGIYVMKKSLAPLNTIRDTLKNIEVNKLGKRITLSSEKNEIYDLALTINKALDRIEYGYKQQQQFINNASHELRTPITVISGYVDLLDRWGKNDPNTLSEGIEAIKSETNYMRQLIERLLFFARSNSGTLSEHFVMTDSADLLQEVYNASSLISEHPAIILEKNESALIYAEPGSVKQMLRIFIDNAVKYTPAEGFIYLSCEIKENKVYFKVRDTGIGIPKKDLHRVFERFYRVDSSRTKETGGSGLGLSIAKYIAKSNRAKLQLESTLHKGTTVIAIFPIYTENEAIV
ncbi:ATP-binding protein [Megasphaera paucivorans]|uniref:histidine kinase n=1 Tax=Megasphaera paucivorans TaxID=349095 RepID=A0A1G9XS26_9FIRM|nr:ATP-binding protein [Megasphaera paucivorans]SDM99629.1 Signal transduction histidine kinase [Megasphaera paucivorans]